MDKEVLKLVMADNQKEIMRHQITHRNLDWEEAANYVLVGIRRAGKSYLLYQRMQELLGSGLDWSQMLYVNFEDERLLGMTTADLNLLLEVHLEVYSGTRPMLFLDEIQNLEGWEKFARRMADTQHRIYITGSNARMLSRDIQTTLGGRFIPVEVYPYSFSEFIQASGTGLVEQPWHSTEDKASLQRLFNDYFYYGGFPEVIRFAAKQSYLNSLYQKIFLGDIATRHGVANTFVLRVLFKKIAESLKQPVSYTRLANIVSATGAKVATNTVINYVEYGRDAWLISAVHNIAGKLADKESAPKYYFNDNGILQLLLMDANTSLLENIVAIHLLRRYGRENAVFFYNKAVEVDFYIPETETAIQVCYNLQANTDTFERETQALVKLRKVLPCRQLMIITRDEAGEWKIQGQHITAVPVWKWLLENN